PRRAASRASAGILRPGAGCGGHAHAGSHARPVVRRGDRSTPLAMIRTSPRRRFLSTLAGSLAAATVGAAASGCRPARPDGRLEASLWFCYGGKNREVLLALIDQFNAEQNRFWIHPTYQGDYFEGLAKLRTAIAANAAPTVTHVVGEVLPYLAEAGVLEAL